MMGWHAEAAEDARLQLLGVAREIGYPLGQVLALGVLSFAALNAGDWTARCGWPGRPGRSPPESRSSPGGAARS